MTPMKKSTPFNADANSDSTIQDKKQKALPTSPKKETINNILAFAHAYSVRKSKSIDKMEFNLN